MFLRANDFLRTCRTALHPAPTSKTLRGTNPMGRHYSLSGVTLDKRLTWSPHIDQVRKNLVPPLNRKSNLSIWSAVLRYKQVICPMMDYACSAWKSSARSHCPVATVTAIQLISPCYWCPRYVSNRQVHKDLGVLLFADHISDLTASFDSKLAGVWNPLIRQLVRYLS